MAAAVVEKAPTSLSGKDDMSKLKELSSFKYKQQAVYVLYFVLWGMGCYETRARAGTRDFELSVFSFIILFKLVHSRTSRSVPLITRRAACVLVSLSA